MLYESGGEPSDGLSVKRSAGSDEPVCAWFKYDDGVYETTDDDAAPRSDADEVIVFVTPIAFSPAGL